MAFPEDPTREDLKAYAEKYPDVVITRRMSIAAGNCEGGTDDFLDMYFHGRKSVKISELISHIEEYSGVRSVLAYKFRKLEKPHKMKPEEQAPAF